jgi:hypothetical protein
LKKNKNPIDDVLKHSPVLFSPKIDRGVGEYLLYEDEFSWISKENYVEQVDVPQLNIDFWLDPKKNKGALFFFRMWITS